MGNRASDELKVALKGLNEYEVPMLLSLVNILAIDKNGKGIIYNALLESFLIHARILIEFLYRDKPYKDTITANQYFKSDRTWENIRPPKSKLLEETENNAHKYLAHLTYTRLKEKKLWPYIKIAKDIETALNVFQENLHDEFTKE